MAEPITQARLRALAAVHPDQGRVLSVFLNLDPTAVRHAQRAIVRDHVGDDRRGAQGRGSDGLSHDERMALRDDVERVREVLLGSDIAANGTRAVAVYACGPEDLLEVVRLRRPVENQVVLDRTAFVEPLVLHGTDEQWMVLLTNRRAARLFFGPGDALEETDRIVDDVHSQHEQGRLVAAQVPALGGEGGLRPPRERRRARVRRSTRSAAPTACWSACRPSCSPSSRASCTRTCASGSPGKIAVDVENASLDDVCAAAGAAIAAHVMRMRARGAGPAGGGRRHAAAAARRASPRCSTRSTRRVWRRC